MGDLPLNRIINGDCIEEMKKLPDECIDTIITDPPYGLGFMDKEWDTFNRNQFGRKGEEGEKDLKMKKDFDILPRYNKDVEASYNLQEWTRQWSSEALRIAKPGAMLFCFGGTRTFHRIACGIEDAGWELRDMIMYVYGSGFPKSHNIGKAIDKKPNADRVKEFKKWLEKQIDKCDKDNKEINKECGFTATSYCKYNSDDYWATNLPSKSKWKKMKEVIGCSNDWDWIMENNIEERGFKEKPTGGLHGGSGNTVGQFTGKQLKDKPIDKQAKKWEGYGTNLKPAYEPIIIAMKPLDGTFAENALEHDVAGLNIEEGRVGTEQITTNRHSGYNSNSLIESTEGKWKGKQETNEGRFPANLIHDGSEEVMRLFPETETGGDPFEHNEEYEFTNNTKFKMGSKIKANFQRQSYRGDSGSAARFFYCAKASKEERGEGNTHPTVKPVSLLEYLVRLTKMPNEDQIYLDPFIGSGTTAIAVKQHRRNFIGFELNEEYVKIANARISKVQAKLF